MLDSGLRTFELGIPELNFQLCYCEGMTPAPTKPTELK